MNKSYAIIQSTGTHTVCHGSTFALLRLVTQQPRIRIARKDSPHKQEMINVAIGTKTGLDKFQPYCCLSGTDHAGSSCWELGWAWLYDASGFELFVKRSIAWQGLIEGNGSMPKQRLYFIVQPRRQRPAEMIPSHLASFLQEKRVRRPELKTGPISQQGCYIFAVA
jgi:hypothetical protein